MLQKSVAVSTLAMLVDVEKHTLDAARVVHHTTVTGRAAYRNSVLTPPTSFNSSQKTTSLISLTSPFAKIE